MTDAVLIAIIAATPPTLIGIGSIIVSLRNYKKIDEVHRTVNSGLSKQLQNASAAGELKGIKDTEQKQK